MFCTNRFKSSSYLKIFALVALLLPASLFAQQELFLPHEAYLMGLSEKFDLKIGGAYLPINNTSRYGNLTSKGQQYSGQIAFSPLNKIGIVGSISQKNGQYKEIPADWDLRYVEIGIGTYHNLSKGNNSNLNSPPRKFSIRTNLYVGRGWGNSHNTPLTAGEVSLKYQRNFLHSGWQFWWKEHFAFSYALRFVNLNVQEIIGVGALPTIYNRSILELANRNPWNFIESSVQLQMGSKQIQVFLSVTRPLGTFGNDYPLGLTKPAYKVGLILDVGWLYKRQKNV